MSWNAAILQGGSCLSFPLSISYQCKGCFRRRQEPTYQDSLCLCASGFDTRPPELILLVVKSKPASVPSWTVAVAVRRRACGFRSCAVVRCASGEWGVLSPLFATSLGGLRYAHQSSSFHLSCPDRYYYACGRLPVCDRTWGLPARFVCRSHRGESDDDRKRFQLPDRCCKLEGRPCCRSSLGQSPRADSQRRGSDWR